MFKHLKDNNETYLSHLMFAGKIGLSLLLRGAVFVLHGLLPLWDIPARLNLENLRDKADKWNKHTEQRLKEG
tara:strand:+ start:397 stop:612 length:216 start_codon:yes stop_codon:yes gene_type:complete